jgi:hypothetical protein
VLRKVAMTRGAFPVLTYAAPQVMATLRNLVISLLRLAAGPTSPTPYDITPPTNGAR